MRAGGARINEMKRTCGVRIKMSNKVVPQETSDSAHDCRIELEDVNRWECILEVHDSVEVKVLSDEEVNETLGFAALEALAHEETKDNRK